MDNSITMTFTSSKYTKEQLAKKGIIATKRITCKTIDKDNPLFISYHIREMLKDVGINADAFRTDPYIIEGISRPMDSRLSDIEILLFVDILSRDRFILENNKNFKMVLNGKTIVEPILMKYFN